MAALARPTVSAHPASAFDAQALTPAPLPLAGEGNKTADSLTAQAGLPTYFFNMAHFDSATVVKAWSPGMVATTFR